MVGVDTYSVIPSKEHLIGSFDHIKKSWRKRCNNVDDN